MPDDDWLCGIPEEPPLELLKGSGGKPPENKKKSYVHKCGKTNSDIFRCVFTLWIAIFVTKAFITSAARRLTLRLPHTIRASWIKANIFIDCSFNHCNKRIQHLLTHRCSRAISCNFGVSFTFRLCITKIQILWLSLSSSTSKISHELAWAKHPPTNRKKKTKIWHKLHRL